MLTADNAAEKGLQWSEIDAYFLTPTEMTEQISLGPVTASELSPTPAPLPPGSALEYVSVEVLMGTNLNAHGLRDMYLAGLFSYRWAVPEPRAIVLLLLGLVHGSVLTGRARSTPGR